MTSMALVFDLIARDRASATITKVGTEAEASSKRMHGMAKALGALVAVDVGVHMVKMAGDFQQSTNVLVTAAGETQKNLAAVRQGILDIASNTGTDWKSLTDGMYQIEKAGYRGADGLNILKAAAQAAREEGASLATVTNAATSIMASYHLKAGDAVTVMNEMKTAAGESKTTMELFAGSLSTVLPLASANHISFADIAGSLATLTQHGTSADQATQELAFTIRGLSAPNMVAIKEMGQLGINSQDVSQKLGQRGLSGTLNMLSETVLRKMGPSGKVLLNTFLQSASAGKDATEMMSRMEPATRKLAEQFVSGKITAKGWTEEVGALSPQQASLARQFGVVENKARGFNTAIRAGMPGAQTYSEAIKKMTGGAAGLNTTLQITGESTAGNTERIKRIAEAAKGAGKDVSGWESTQKLFNVQMAMAKERIDAAGITLGTLLLPAVTAVAKGFVSLLGFVQRNSDVMKPLLAVFGTLVITIFAIIKAQKAWIAVQTAFNIVMDANPITLVVLAVAALVVGLIYAYKHSETFRNIVQGALHAVTTAGKAVFDFFKAHWPLLAGILLGPFGLIVGEVIHHWGAISGAFSAGYHAVVGFAERMWHDVAGFFTRMWHDMVAIGDSIAGFFKRHWRLLLLIVTGGFGLIWIIVQDHWKLISGAFSAGYHAVSGFVSRMWHDVAGFVARMWHDVAGFVERMWKDVSGFVARMWHDVAGAVTAMWHAVAGTVSRLWHDVTGFFARIARDVFHSTDGTRSAVSGSFSRIYKDVTGFASRIWHDVTGFFGRMKTDVVSTVDHMVTAIGSAWGKVEGVVATPVKWVVDHVYQDGIRPAWNAIAGVLHEDSWKMPDLHFAGGGVVPGNHNRDTVPFFGTPGEVVVPKHVVARFGGPQSLMSGLGFTGTGGAGGHYAGGGVLGTIGGIASGIGHGISNVAGAAVGGLGHLVQGALSMTIGPLLRGLERAMDGVLNPMGGAGQLLDLVARKGIDALLGQVKGSDAKAMSGGGAAGPVGAGVARWRGVVDQVLSMLGLPRGIDNGILSIIAHESGGNPNAINLWDSNARAGHPSQGLMQTIPATFAAYAGALASRGITDPLANVYAGVNYAYKNYGLGMLASGGRHSGGGYIGYDSGGLLGPGFTPVLNATGRPERVLSARDTAVYEELLTVLKQGGGVRGGGVTVNGPFYSYDPSDIPREIQKRQRDYAAVYGLGVG